MDISRRNFLKGSAIGTLGLVASSVIPSVVSSAVAEENSDISWDYEADVVILGAGGAGLVAGLKAVEDGASVILVEANWEVGGHAAVSGGLLHSGAGTSVQQQYEIEDSPDQYYIDHTADGVYSRYNDREYVRSVADYMVEAYDFIQEKGVILIEQKPQSLAGNDPDKIPRQTRANADIEKWTYIPSGLTAEEGSKASNMGIGLTRPLERSLRESGAQFIMNYHMDKIYRADNNTGRVLGIQASYTPTILPGETEPLKGLWDNGNIESTKETINVKANKSVIIATGGHSSNVRFRTMFDPRQTIEYDGVSGEPFSKQDASGELAALAIGASMGTLANKTQDGGVDITQPRYFGCQYGYTNLRWEPTSKIFKLARASGLTCSSYEDIILVNALGKRFANEDNALLGGKNPLQYTGYFQQALSSVIVDEGTGHARRIGGPIWAIFDQAAVDRRGWSLTDQDVDREDGRFFSGNTIEELAQNIVNKYYEDIKMDPAVLAETIRMYNMCVEVGADPAFGKTSLEYKIEQGPFYAAWATPCLHDCCSGLRVTSEMQVVDYEGNGIPGLYAIGESSGGMRVHGFGRVLTSAYIGGKFAAK